MSAIESQMVIYGYAWIDDETEEIGWAYREELQHKKPSERPEGCTPVVIEINPTDDYVTKKQQEQEYFGNLSDQLSQFKDELAQVRRDLEIGE